MDIDVDPFFATQVTITLDVYKQYFEHKDEWRCDVSGRYEIYIEKFETP